ncbi:MAG: hypothetical protein ACI9WU_004065 [Myxococcota bacterium]|jgi:hypothetical protein
MRSTFALTATLTVCLAARFATTAQAEILVAPTTADPELTLLTVVGDLTLGFTLMRVTTR